MSIYYHDLLPIGDNNNIIPIEEAYIGKTPILLEIENKIARLREEVSMYKDNNSNKTLMEISKLFEKQFGMEIFAIRVDKSLDINASTMPIGRYFDMVNEDMRSYVIGDNNNGYRFRKGNGLCIVVNITYGLLKDERMTNEGILGVILHEIGHQFASCLSNDIALYNKDLINSYLIMLAQYSMMNAADQYTNSYEKEKETKKRKKNKNHKIKGLFGGILRVIGNKIIDRIYVSDRTNKNSANYINAYKAELQKEKEKNKDNKDLPENKFGYNINRFDETFADRFAAVYGYSTGLLNLLDVDLDITGNRLYKKARKKGKIAQLNNDLYEEALFDISDYDEHPNALQRMNNILASLKSEIAKDDLDPRVKEELKYQISNIEKEVENLTTVRKKLYRIEKKRNKYLSNLNDKNPTGLEDGINELIDDILDKALEEEENRRNKNNK